MFMPTLLELPMCIGHGLKMCIWLGYNHQIIFLSFFPQVERSHFSSISSYNFHSVYPLLSLCFPFFASRAGVWF